MGALIVRAEHSFRQIVFGGVPGVFASGYGRRSIPRPGSRTCGPLRKPTQTRSARFGDDPHVDVECSNNCPYGATRVILREPGGPGAVQAPESELGPIPLTKPPYAHLVAIDLNVGEIVWKEPFGDGSDELRTHPLLRDVDLPERLGTLGNSGPLVTKVGLVFLGGGDPYLYPFDKATGVELWRGAT